MLTVRHLLVAASLAGPLAGAPGALACADLCLSQGEPDTCKGHGECRWSDAEQVCLWKDAGKHKAKGGGHAHTHGGAKAAPAEKSYGDEAPAK